MKKVRLLVLLLFSGMFVIAQNSRFEDEGDTTAVVQQAEEQAPVAKSPPKATKKNKSDFWSRTRFGGNLGAGFSNGFSYVNVSPRMYYLATEKLWLGAGFTFIWSKEKNYPPPYDEQFVYGFNMSAQYMLFGPIFLQAEYEPLSYERPDIFTDPGTGQSYIVGEERIWIHGVLLGGGISQRIGNSGMFFASILYNVTWSNSIDSYYSSPWVFRIGFGI